MDKTTQMRTLLIAGLILVVGAGIWWQYGQGAENPETPTNTETTTNAPVATAGESDKTPTTSTPSTNNQTPPPAPATNSSLPATVRHSVVFTSQAPNGDWSDPRQQDGCEEASILMAAKWARGQGSFASGEALREILALSHKAEEMFGTFHDSSAADTLKLYKAYFGLTGRLEYNVSQDDIKKELAAGRVVVVPLNGQKLNNPNFTPPGPDRHMLIIIGYDATGFITNDPGTRAGRGYKYSYATLMNALVDYPTGDHGPLFSKNKNAMIVMAKA